MATTHRSARSNRSIDCENEKSSRKRYWEKKRTGLKNISEIGYGNKAQFGHLFASIFRNQLKIRWVKWNREKVAEKKNVHYMYDYVFEFGFTVARNIWECPTSQQSVFQTRRKRCTNNIKCTFCNIYFFKNMCTCVMYVYNKLICSSSSSSSQEIYLHFHGDSFRPSTISLIDFFRFFKSCWTNLLNLGEGGIVVLSKFRHLPWKSRPTRLQASFWYQSNVLRINGVFGRCGTFAVV